MSARLLSAATLFGTFVGGALLVASCTGADGAAGASGVAGAAGSQGTPGPVGSTGAMGPTGIPDGGTIATSCMSPCHGFNGVIAQFQTSIHYSTYVANAGTDTATEWTAPGAACGNCHAIDALAQRTALGTTGDAGVTNAAHGELEYLSSATGKVTDSNYTGSAIVAEVYCTTCHAVTPANDPHVTGIPWTPGSFPLVVASGATDLPFLEKSPSLSATTGSSAGAMGTANACVWCHKSRKDVTSYITASNVLTSTHWGPHEGPQADLFSASGGYQYAGLTYGTSTHQQKLTCVDCHMPEVTANRGVPDHSFAPRLSACQSCHAGETSFNISGGQTLVKGGMVMFQKALNDLGYLTRSVASPYAILQPTEIADGAFELDQPRPGGAPLTAAQAGALYNYILIARGGASGVHNPTYIKQLLVDSYAQVQGANPAMTVPRP
jgi:Cytochrome c552